MARPLATSTAPSATQPLLQAECDKNQSHQFLGTLGAVDSLNDFQHDPDLQLFPERRQEEIQHLAMDVQPSNGGYAPKPTLFQPTNPSGPFPNEASVSKHGDKLIELNDPPDLDIQFTEEEIALLRESLERMNYDRLRNQAGAGGALDYEPPTTYLAE